jgi:hypothetical protein
LKKRSKKLLSFYATVSIIPIPGIISHLSSVLRNTTPSFLSDFRRFDALKYEIISWDWYSFNRPFAFFSKLHFLQIHILFIVRDLQ